MRSLPYLLLVAMTPTLGCCGFHHFGGGCMGGHEHGTQAAPVPEASPSSGTAQPSATAKYFCSMHPEVQATFPGTCPVCGMTLVKE